MGVMLGQPNYIKLRANDLVFRKSFMCAIFTAAILARTICSIVEFHTENEYFFMRLKQAQNHFRKKIDCLKVMPPLLNRSAIYISPEKLYPSCSVFYIPSWAFLM